MLESDVLLKISCWICVKYSRRLGRTPDGVGLTRLSPSVIVAVETYVGSTANEIASPAKRPVTDSIKASFGNAGTESCILIAPFTRSKIPGQPGELSSNSASNSSPYRARQFAG